MGIVYASNASRDASRGKVLEYLREKKRQNPAFKVADIGGSANSWADSVVDIYIDIVAGSSAKPTVLGDINLPHVWSELKTRHGKIDFILCTHTLEDIRDPVFVIERLQEAAHGGYISTPNKYSELSHVESHFFTGWSHHRWIFSLVQKSSDWSLKFIPKYASANVYSEWSNHPLVVIKRALHLTNKDKGLPSRSIPALKANKAIANLKNELGFIWEGRFDYEYTDYFPSTKEILGSLRRLIEDGL
jgi:hypothetical protein